MEFDNALIQERMSWLYCVICSDTAVSFDGDSVVSRRHTAQTGSGRIETNIASCVGMILRVPAPEIHIAGVGLVDQRLRNQLSIRSAFNLALSDVSSKARSKVRS
jgi:hypothetical protein